MIDMHRVLLEMRKKFYAARKGWFYSSTNDQIPPLPSYKEDKLARFWDFQPRLLQKGVIYWSKIVQANGQLFRPGSFHLPGEIVVSPQPIFESNPGLLGPIAEGIGRLKFTEPSDPELAAVAASITNETDRTLGKTVPVQLTEGHNVFRFTVLFYRPQLPFGRVHSIGYYPVLLIHGCPFTMVLPSKYWPADYVELHRPTAAEMKWEETRRRNQLLVPPVILTTAAQERFMATMLKVSLDPLTTFVRVAVLPDQNYYLNFETMKKDGDTEFTTHGLRVLVDPYTLQNFRGVEVDWLDYGTMSGFEFTEYMVNYKIDDDEAS